MMKILRRLAALSIGIIPLVIYALLLTGRSPRLDYWGSVARYGFGPAILLAFALLFAFYLIPGPVGGLVSFTGLLALFGLSLAGLWSQGYSSSMIVSGLLPWSDAGNYYLDAQRLVAGDWFTPFSAWRPLSPGFLAFLLALTGHSLQAAIACLVFITAVSVYLLSREVQRHYGAAAGVLVAMLLFLYYRQRIGGSVLTENLGLALAALGFALLLRGAGQEKAAQSGRAQSDRVQSDRTSSRFHILAGVFLVAFALNVRPGTFGVLPALLVWVAVAFRKDKGIPWKILAVAGGLMLLAFAANSAVIRLVSNEPTLPFSNFSDTLYGVAAGGKGFLQAVRDHPELNQMQGIERHLRLFQLTAELIRQHPLGLVQGALNQWSLFFFSGWYGLFSYASGETRWVSTAARLVLYLLLLLGLFFLAKQQNNRHRSLLLLSALGVVLSVPFVPPQDGYWLRLYAPSLPVIVILPALGLAFLTQRVKIGRFQFIAASSRLGENNAAVVFAGGLVLLVLAAPLVVRLISHPSELPSAAGCPTGQEELFVRLDRGSLVKIFNPEDLSQNWLPNFQRGHFKDFIHGLPVDEQMAEFLRLEHSPTLAHTIDLKTMQPVFLVVYARLIPAYGVPLSACGNWSTTPEGQEFHFFYAKSVTVQP